MPEEKPKQRDETPEQRRRREDAYRAAKNQIPPIEEADDPGTQDEDKSGDKK